MDQKERERVKQLIEDAEKFCSQKLGYKKLTMYTYDRSWRYLLNLMEESGIDYFNVKTAKIIEDKIGYQREGQKGKNVQWHSSSYKYYYLRALKMLLQFQENRTINGRLKYEEEITKHPEPINSQVLEFSDYLTLKLRRDKITVNAYKRTMNEFVVFLTKQGISSFSEIDISIILDYIRTMSLDSKFTPFLKIGHIRGLLKYLYQNKIINQDLSAQIPKCKRVIQPKLPSVYSAEEIKQLLNSNPRITGNQKRDYAILLLMARLGLRVSDVANLKFENIKWRENKIELIQYKTGRPIELPLLADVGNALIDYIKNGRIDYKSDNIFLRSRYPHVMNRINISSIVIGAFEKAGISVEGKHHGPHSLRHSLSARMLEESTIMPVITEVLGHEKAETTQYYMRIDLKSLRKCLIETPTIPNNHFEKLLKEYERFIF